MTSLAVSDRLQTAIEYRIKVRKTGSVARSLTIWHTCLTLRLNPHFRGQGEKMSIVLQKKNKKSTSGGEQHSCQKAAQTAYTVMT